ncbi:MAG: hypothetical protein HRU20_12370 [Pseudomonadales bacterium]|nr:hypothetical protein [Pseudomonadales bacterium]
MKLVKKSLFKTTLIAAILTIILTPLSSWANTQQFCFSYASSLYQQVYCELKAEGQGQNLPSFYDFRKNDNYMQYLLLKPHVRKLAMKLPKPVKKSRQSSPASIQKHTPPANTQTQQAVSLNTSQAQQHSNCQLQGDIISCGTIKHQLQYNLNNKHLEKHVFTPDNKMALPQFQGENKNQYLAKAYAVYLDKMLAIGLAGVTLSYSKFYHLFDELQQRNMDFSQRFEKMYFYLKKDKEIMMVNTQKNHPRQLSLKHCDTLNQYWICATAQKNYIFKRL